MKRALLIALGSLAVAGVLGFFLLRDRTPALTRAALEEALARWKRSGIADYELFLRVEGDRSVDERFRVLVRSGKAVEGEKDGAPLPSLASAQAYTVDGLFEIIDEELRNASGPPLPGAPRRPLLRASFDPERGYPLVFERIAPEGMSRFIRAERFTGGPR